MTVLGTVRAGADRARRRDLPIPRDRQTRIGIKKPTPFGIGFVFGRSVHNASEFYDDIRRDTHFDFRPFFRVRLG